MEPPPHHYHFCVPNSSLASVKKNTEGPLQSTKIWKNKVIILFLFLLQCFLPGFYSLFPHLKNFF